MSCRTFNNSYYSMIGNSLTGLVNFNDLPMQVFIDHGFVTPEKYSTSLRNWNFRSVSERYGDPEILKTPYKHINLEECSFKTLIELLQAISDVDYSCYGADDYQYSNTAELSNRLMFRLQGLLKDSANAEKKLRNLIIK